MFPKTIPGTAHHPAQVHQATTLIGGAYLTFPGAPVPVLSPVCLAHAGALTQVPLGSLPPGGVEEAEAALAAAVAAYADGAGAWPTMTVAARIACMESFTHAMAAARDEVVPLLMWEIGKTLDDSKKEFDRTVSYIRATIAALKDLDNANSRFQAVEGVIGQIRRTPLGVVLVMGPYNYPLNETFALLIPALIMGNTVVFKPPRFGVLLFTPLLKAFCDAFPPGVVNFVHGKGELVVPLLLESGKVNTLALIGSSKVAGHLKKLHPKTNRLRAILGLDAKNAAIILPDADLDLAVSECAAGALAFNGQRCTALKMLLVHRSIVAPFLDKLAAAINALKLGMPWEPGVAITPLPDPAKVAQMQGYLDDAIAQGARVINRGGGHVLGTLFTPALVYPVTPAMRLYRDEQFGPIVPVAAFDDVAEALEYVRTSEHGQQVSVFGTDPATIGRLVDPLVNQVCRVNINSQCQRGPDVFPFTGRKDSAEGTLSVTDALRAFSIRSMIATKETAPNKRLLEAIIADRVSNFINTNFIF
jgi:acyl-CoA reductase-like NAD-dependent aldehyde dehydrogenase